MAHCLEIPRWTSSQHGKLSGSYYLLSTLSCTHATEEASRFWGCGQFLTFIIKRILGIKCILGIECIFPCSFENKRMRLLTHVYGILQKYDVELFSHESMISGRWHPGPGLDGPGFGYATVNISKGVTQDFLHELHYSFSVMLHWFSQYLRIQFIYNQIIIINTCVNL